MTVLCSIQPEPAPQPAAARQEAPGHADRYKVVSVRLRSAELEGFYEQAKAFELTGNLALRIVARRVGGFLEIDYTLRFQRRD